jgi:hypothetical protein
MVVAAPFTEGNLAIYRVGDGAHDITDAPEAVFIDEYTPTGALVQSIALPTTSSGLSAALTAQGSAALEGLINRSTDGQYLVLTGYDHNLGDAVPAGPGDGTLAQTTALQVPRTIGRIDINGAVDTTTTYNDSGQGSPRSVISNNGTDFFIAQASISGGMDGGVRSTTLGSAGSSTSISQQVPDLRHIDFFDGQLYVSSATSGENGILSVDVGASTLTGLTGIPGGTTDANTVQFFLADLSETIAGVDTAYVADNRSQNNGGGLQKYSLDGTGTWNLTGGIAGVQTPAVSNLRGLTGVVDELGSVTLYGTRIATAGGVQTGQLLKFADSTGHNGTMTGTAELLITTADGYFFKGLDFVPVLSVGQPGDHNVDGVVDAADYVAWRKLNIDGPDGYDDFVENFGEGGGEGGQQGILGVPEPTVIGFLTSAAMILLSFARGRRNEFARAFARRIA